MDVAGEDEPGPTPMEVTDDDQQDPTPVEPPACVTPFPEKLDTSVKTYVCTTCPKIYTVKLGDVINCGKGSGHVVLSKKDFELTGKYEDKDLLKLSFPTHYTKATCIITCDACWKEGKGYGIGICVRDGDLNLVQCVSIDCTSTEGVSIDNYFNNYDAEIEALYEAIDIVTSFEKEAKESGSVVWDEYVILSDCLPVVLAFLEGKLEHSSDDGVKRTVIKLERINSCRDLAGLPRWGGDTTRSEMSAPAPPNIKIVHALRELTQSSDILLKLRIPTVKVWTWKKIEGLSKSLQWVLYEEKDIAVTRLRKRKLKSEFEYHAIVSGHTLLHNKRQNKGIAFTETERDAYKLRGLLPPAVVSQELQVSKIMQYLRSCEVPLQSYTAMMDLQENNESLFYKMLIDNVEELLPVVSSTTVMEAFQRYGSIFRRPQGLHISLKDKGKILEVLRNWPERSIQVIVVTDGENILGLGDLGCQAMGISVGKLFLYTALGGVYPSACLPITLDVGTNNLTLLNDESYIGLKQKRASGQEYADFLEEFMTAVMQSYGAKVFVQFENFADQNASELLAKYGMTNLVFNDDIQGTACVVLAGLIAAQKLVGLTLVDLVDHTFLFFGAGEAGTFIAELIAAEISRQTMAPLEKTRKKQWLVDSQGLVVSSRMESLELFKKPWAHDYQPLKTLLEAVQAIKPTVLIGTSGMGQSFTQEVVEAMANFNEKPLIVALSNSISQTECTAEQAYTWSKGKAIFASGSHFDPVEYEGNTFVPSQANNAYIFPGFGLGLIMSGAIRVHNDMLLLQR